MDRSHGEQTGSGFNADKLRLEEHAKVIGNVASFIDALETHNLKIESHDTISFDVLNDGTTAIPQAVVDAIGPVKTIDVHLALNQELLPSTDPIFEVDTEPSDERFMMSIGESTPHNHETTPVANISLHLESDAGLFVISRSSLKSTTPTTDGGAFASGETFQTDPIPQDEVNDLILSLLEPTPLAERTHAQSIDYLEKPEVFGVIQELFQDASFNNQNALGYVFHTSDTQFKYIRTFDEIEQLYRTSFNMRTMTKGDGAKEILAYSSMDTEFTTSFETIFTTDAHTRLIPYVPTLSELAQLNEMLMNEIQYIEGQTASLTEYVVHEDELILDERDTVDQIVDDKLVTRTMELDTKISDAVLRLIGEDPEEDTSH